MPVSKPKGKKRKPRQRPPEYDFDEPVEFVAQFASPLDAIVERLKNVAQATDTQNDDGTWTRQFNALCPAHNDHSRSLSLSETTEGTTIVCCHAGCTAKEILKAIGLKLLHLYSKDSPRMYKPKPNPWQYYTRVEGGVADE